MSTCYFTAFAYAGVLYYCFFLAFVCPTVQAKYYSVCSALGFSTIDVFPFGEVVLVGSGEKENSTSYKPNLSCQLLIRAPPGWSVAAKVRYEKLDWGKDIISAFDGGYEAKHVTEITPFNKNQVVHTTGNVLLLRFTSDSLSEPLYKGFLLEIWANYTSSPKCKCQSIENGETSCHFVGNTGKGERFKSCEIQCSAGTTLYTRSNFYPNKNIKETVRCNLNNGQWLTKPITGPYVTTDLLDTPVQCDNYTIPTKMVAKYSISYANSNCSFINSSLKEIGVRVREMINTTNLPTSAVCFNEARKSDCSIENLDISCQENDTGISGANVTLQIRDQMAKTVNVTKSDFMTLWYAFMGVTSQIKVYFRSGKFNVRKDYVTVNATGLVHEDSKGVCPAQLVFINLPGLQGICTTCPPGYQHKSTSCQHNLCYYQCDKCRENSQCFTPAPTGSYTDCNMRCPVGKGYNKTLGFCDWCPYDTYQNDSVTPQASCIKCPLARSKTPYMGAANEADCIQPCTVGQYVAIKTDTPPECKPCPINTYLDIIYPHVERGCKTCPSNNPITQGNGSTKAEDCVEKCSLGKFYNVSAKQCEECKKNTYQDRKGQFLCNDCPAGRVTTGAGTTGVQFCFSPCPAGTFVNLAVNPVRCENCPIGTFQAQNDHDNTNCQSCGEHKTTNKTGAVSENECFWVCIEGEFFNLTSHQCEKCLKGTYQNERAQETCKPCPKGKVTLQVGSNSSADCIPSCPRGRYMDHKDQGRCLDCPVGSYQDKADNSAGKESCLRCPDLKTTTKTEGTDNVTKCIPYCDVMTRCENGGTCADKDGGYTCACANFLEGKHCELIKDVSKAENVTFNLTFTSIKWYEDLRNPNSVKFRETAEVVENAIRSVVNTDKNFRAVRVNSFFKGSVVADFDITYVPDNSSEAPLKTLSKAVEVGDVGGLAVVNDSLGVVTYTCQQPLGMEDRRIKDSWITASSSRAKEWPWNARLKNHRDIAWCEIPGTAGQPYLQIDFNRQVVITGVATQGRLGDRFVKSYSLAFASNLTSWTIYTDTSGQEKEFSGNSDSNSVVTNKLPNRVAGRFLRFLPKDYTAHQLCMRVEVYGCTLPQGSTPSTSPTLPSVPVHPTDGSTDHTATPTSQVSKTTSLVVPGEKDDKTGLIVGVVLGVFFFILLVALIVYCCYRKKMSCVGPAPANKDSTDSSGVKLKRITSKKDKDEEFHQVLPENLSA